MWVEAGLFALKLFWLAGLFPALFNALGIILYGSPERSNAANLSALRNNGWTADKKLVVAFVSRGDNDRALARSIHTSRAVLMEYTADFDIEIVTDIEVASKVGPMSNVHYTVVPPDYIPQNGAKWKARALSYLQHVSAARVRADGSSGGVWILHMDEESQLTPSALAGIHRFINAPQNALKIGQGEIKYNAYRYGENVLITAMDSIRTGDDLGRFRLQFKLFGRAFFGMHGSFILVPAAIENVIGFDHGGRGSVTEDAYFALKALEKGYRFGWVDGFIREQSPYTIVDLIRQRRRWFCGLRLLANDLTIRPGVRLPLAFSVFLWRWMWVGVLATIVNLIATASYFPAWLGAVATTIGAATAIVYMVGAYRNQRDVEFALLLKLRVYTVIMILMPVMGFIENMAVIWALLRPVKGFDVLDKN